MLKTWKIKKCKKTSFTSMGRGGEGERGGIREFVLCPRKKKTRCVWATVSLDPTETQSCPQTVTHPSSNHLTATWLGVEPTTSRSNILTVTPPSHLIIMIQMTMFMVLSSGHCHCKSSPGSSDEHSMSAGRPVTFVSSQSTLDTDLAIVSTFTIVLHYNYSARKLVLILPSYAQSQ